MNLSNLEITRKIEDAKNNFSNGSVDFEDVYKTIVK